MKWPFVLRSTHEAEMARALYEQDKAITNENIARLERLHNSWKERYAALMLEYRAFREVEQGLARIRAGGP